MNLDNIIPALIGVLIGGFITWFVSWFYYKKAGDKLKQEATRLHRLTNLVLHGLENAGIMEMVKDASGEPTGIVITVGSTIAGEGWVSSKGEVIPRKSPNHNVTEASDVDSAKNTG